MAEDESSASQEGRKSWEVLNERVANQGGQIKSLADDTAKQFLDFRENTKQQFAGFRSDVSAQFASLNDTLKVFGSKFDTSQSSLADKSRTNWFGLIGTGATAIGVSFAIATGILNLRLTPIENKQNDITSSVASISADLKVVSTNLSGYETRSEIADSTKATRDAQDAYAKASTLAIDSLIAVTGKLEESKVSNKDMEFIVRERNGFLATQQKAIDAQDARLAMIERTYVPLAVHMDRWAKIDANAEHNRDALEVVEAHLATVTALQQTVLHRLDQNDADIRATQGNRFTKEDALQMRTEFSQTVLELRGEIKAVDSRVQTIYENNYATPAYPALRSGAGAAQRIPFNGNGVGGEK